MSSDSQKPLDAKENVPHAGLLPEVAALSLTPSNYESAILTPSSSAFVASQTDLPSQKTSFSFTTKATSFGTSSFPAPSKPGISSSPTADEQAKASQMLPKPAKKRALPVSFTRPGDPPVKPSGTFNSFKPPSASSETAKTSSNPIETPGSSSPVQLASQSASASANATAVFKAPDSGQVPSFGTKSAPPPRSTPGFSFKPKDSAAVPSPSAASTSTSTSFSFTPKSSATAVAKAPPAASGMTFAKIIPEVKQPTFSFPGKTTTPPLGAGFKPPSQPAPTTTTPFGGPPMPGFRPNPPNATSPSFSFGGASSSASPAAAPSFGSSPAMPSFTASPAQSNNSIPPRSNTFEQRRPETAFTPAPNATIPWSPAECDEKSPGVCILEPPTSTPFKVGLASSLVPRDFTAALRPGLGSHSKDSAPLDTPYPWSQTLCDGGFGQICFNSLGDLYCTSLANHSIIMMHPNGAFAHVAGDPHSGQFRADTNGPFNSARMHSPCGANFDRLNRLFVSQLSTHNIRLLDFSTRMVSSFDRTQIPAPGHRDDELSKALFHSPRQLKFTKRGDLLVCDSSNSAIRIILADAFTGLISPHSRVRTLCSRISNATSMHIMPSGRLLVLGRQAMPMIVNHNGRSEPWGISGQNIASMCVDPAGKRVAFCTSNDWNFGMVDMDSKKETLGVVTHLDGLNFAQSSWASRGFSSEDDLVGLVELPDGSGFIHHFTVTRNTQLIMFGDGSPFFAPYHHRPAFNLRLLLKNDSSQGVDVPLAIHPTHGVSYPLHELILKFRCPSLLVASTLSALMAFPNVSKSAYDDLFSYIYEDTIAPSYDDELAVIHHLIQLHLLASTCQLQAFTDFLKYRIFSIMSTYSCAITPFQLIKHVLHVDSSPNPTENSLLADFFTFLANQPPQVVQDQVDQLVDIVEDKVLLKKMAKLKFATAAQDPFVLPPLVDPFRTLGPSLAPLAPTIVDSDTTDGDFVIVVSGKSISVHSLILGARWPYFARMLSSNLQEAINRRWEDAHDLGFTTEGMIGFLRYLYTGALDGLNTDEDCYPLVEHADFFGLAGNLDHEALLRHCTARSEFTQIEASENPDFLPILESAILSNNQALMNRTIQAIAKDFDQIYNSPKLAAFEMLPIKPRLAVMRAVKALQKLPKGF